MERDGEKKVWVSGCTYLLCKEYKKSIIFLFFVVLTYIYFSFLYIFFINIFMKNIYNAKNIAVHDQSQYLFRFYTSHKFSFFYYYIRTVNRMFSISCVVQYNKKYGCLSVFSKSHNVNI